MRAVRGFDSQLGPESSVPRNGTGAPPDGWGVAVRVDAPIFDAAAGGETAGIRPAPFVSQGAQALGARPGSPPTSTMAERLRCPFNGASTAGDHPGSRTRSTRPHGVSAVSRYGAGSSASASG